jgi:uncharacterized protein
VGRPVAWFDITAKDAPTSRKFYEELFCWRIDVLEDMSNYGLVDTGATGGVPGGIGQADDRNPACITLYVAVEDIQGTLDRVEELGGKIAVPAHDLPGVGVLAVFCDPDRNQVGIWQRE